MSDQRRVAEVLHDAALALRDAGIERPRVDAEILLAHVLRVHRIDLLAHPERLLTPEEYAHFTTLVSRRSTRYPLPYLTGVREFMGLEFLVNEHVLIPRPETEILVEAAITFLRDWLAAHPADDSLVALDVGAGSGAIAVSLAHEVPQARVLATDSSPEACAVARENARRLGVAERVTVLEGDLLAPLENCCGAGVPPEQRAVLLCANLPYVPDEHLDQLQPEVRDWEPRGALAGGPGGLQLIERMLEQAPDYLRPGGGVLCEIGPECDQPERLTAFLQASGCWREVRVLDDLAGLPRVVGAIRI